MPPTGKSASAAEALKNVLGELSQIATMPDADPKFFTQIIQGITQYLRQQGTPTGPQPGQGPPGAQGGPGAPPPPGMGPQGPPPGPGGLGSGGGPGQQGLSVTGQIAKPGAPAGPTGGAMPPTSPDELRRILGQGQ